jgi:N-methylhydantoinase A
VAVDGRASARRVAGEPGPPSAIRRVYFGPASGWLATPILSRADLATPREGPAIVEEYDSTCVVPPGARAALDGWDNIVMDV